MKRMVRKILILAVASIAVASVNARAALVDVPYTGLYNEATGVEAAGDYDNIGGLSDVGVFDLVAGPNVFLGSIGTPGDSSDFFVVRVGAGQTLSSASIVWGTNVSLFNPLFAFPGPLWTLEESDATPTIFLVPDLNGDGNTAPQSIPAPAFSRGEGAYNMLIGNGVFGTNDGPVGYSMQFIVDAPASVPEPGSLLLLGAALAGLAFARRKLR